MGRNREVTWDNVDRRVRWDRRQWDVVMMRMRLVNRVVMRKQLGSVNDVECRGLCWVVLGRRRRWGMRGRVRVVCGEPVGVHGPEADSSVEFAGFGMQFGVTSLQGGIVGLELTL